jgi:hypothetical protein
MPRFIPDFHFRNPAEKLKSPWCMEAVNFSYFQSGNEGLLDGKKVEEIDQYSEGKIDMKPFKRIFKSLKRKMMAANDPNVVNNDVGVDQLDMAPLPLIPQKLNAAASVLHKIPIEIECKALDPLAARKKENDIKFLKNKPKIEADLQALADDMGIGKVDLGTTQHSAVPFSDSPYGLDLHEPDELDIFVNILYQLGVEASFETMLQAWYELKNDDQNKLLEIIDQYKYGVSVHRAFTSPITGLPESEYVHPSTMRMPKSMLPNFDDTPHRFIEMRLTAMEFFNYIADEIDNDKNKFDELLNGKDGYCACNNLKRIDAKEWGTFKINIVLCEIKSVDWIGIGTKKNSRRGVKVLTTDENETTERLWGQNTYVFYWLKNTQNCFNIHRLEYAHRSKGNEAFQGFSTNIYRSQKVSAVEHAIGENKKAQIADIKLQHAILKSLPAGKYIDLKYLRNALDSLEEEGTQYTLQDLINLAMEQNIMIGDSEGFEGKNDGQFLPIKEIAGGIKSELEGYVVAIKNAKTNIADFTGINDQLTGASANPEGLVGMQKLLINSSLNSLYYVNDALKNQYQRKFNIWSFGMKKAVKEGGKAKEAIVAMVGKRKASLIGAINDVSLHDIGTTINLGQREEKRAELKRELEQKEQQGRISMAQKYFLSNIENPKDAFALLIVAEKQWQKRQDMRLEADRQHQQQMVEKAGENQQNAIAAEGEQEIKAIYAKGDVQSKVITLAHQLGLSDKQTDGLIKMALQKDRHSAQYRKQQDAIATKADKEQQKAFEKTGF